MAHIMLTENDVVGAVSEYLEQKGYAIKHTATTKQRGIDIVALHPSSGRTVLVEAKGETTSKETAHQGEAFTRAQCRTHLAVALYTTARLRDSATKRRKQVVAIALPDVAPHPELVEKIQSSLRSLGVGVFWVRQDRSVRLVASWRLDSRVVKARR